MKEAFNFMFKDNMYKQKALTYFIFALLANLLTQISLIFAPVSRGAVAPPQYYILSILSTIAMFIPTGYLISCIKAIMDQNGSPVLPFLNVKNNFILGFKFFISVIFLSISVGFLFVILVVLLALLTPKELQSLLYIILTIFFIIPFLVIVFYSPAFCCLLAKKEWFFAFFSFKRATKLIGSDFLNYLKRFGLIVLLVLLGGGISSAINLLLPSNYVGAVIMALIISAISSYTVFVFAHLTAKSVKVECIE